MNYPTVKSLLRINRLEPEQAAKLRKVLIAWTREQVADLSPAAAAYMRACYHPPAFYCVKLEAANEVIGGYGVEGVCFPAESWSNCQTPRASIEYINLGDTYTTTLCRIQTPRGTTYRVTSYGDAVESIERRWPSLRSSE